MITKIDASYRLILILFITLSISGCSKTTKKKVTLKNHAAFLPETAPVPKADNLLLIVIDTLRADRLGCYGYKDQPTTPALDAIAAQSIIFDRFYTASPWTAPAFGTLLTGVSPLLHKTGWWLKDPEKGSVLIGNVNLYSLNSRLYTLAELLNTRVSATFASNPFLDPKLGFARGVDHYDQTPEHRRADVVTSQALTWLKNNGDQKFFVMLHYMDTHTPYDPLPEYKKQFTKNIDPGRIKAPFAPSQSEALKLHPSKNELQYIKSLYNAELRFVDDEIKRLFETIDKQGLLDNTWIVITADHGEEQWDHGDFNHGFQYENEVTRVPLIIRAPKGKWGAKKRVPYSVPMKDLLPTFLSWFNIAPPKYIEGKNIMPVITGKEKNDRPCYMEFQLYRKQKYAYFNGRYKIIKPETGPGEYMYDLLKDPEEQHKITKHTAEYKKISKEIREYQRARLTLMNKINNGLLEAKTELDSDEQNNDALSNETVKSLKALGYIK